MSRKLTNDGYINQLKEKGIWDKYRPIEEYVTNQTKIRHKCLKCNHVWTVKPNDIKSGKGCPNCADTKLTTEEYKKQAVNLGYEAMEEYVNNKTKIKHKCLTCGNVWRIAPNTIKSGKGCPNCAPSSKGEQTIENALTGLALFESEKRFSDCVDKLPLPFDFFIYENNLLIEYQGSQHMKETSGYMRSKLADRKRKDKIKRTYAKANQYLLASIPHTITGTNLVSLTEHLLQCTSQREVNETILHHMLMTTDVETSLQAIEVYQLTA